MFTISEQDTTRLIDPIAVAQRYGDFQNVWLGGGVDGIRLVPMRTLLAEAIGPGHRKKAGYWHGKNSRSIDRMLMDLSHCLYSPRAEAALVSSIESRALEIPYDRQPSLVAMIPADQYVVVADLRTETGSDLMDARIDLPSVLDVGCARDVMDRVQRENAVDFISVTRWALGAGW